MSGSSGSDGYGPSDGGGAGVDCHHFVERLQLSSPNPPVVGNLNLGEVLSVALNQSGSVPILEAITVSQQVAGSLIPRGMARLIECMGQGVNYSATILEINGGLVNVEIRAI